MSEERTALETTLAWAVEVGTDVPLPGHGTAERWDVLVKVAAQDLTRARVLEPHLDALAILAEAGERRTDGASWGVWAAEAPGARLEAHRVADGWKLSGRKAWCSLAGVVGHGLVTAWLGDGERGMFAVDLAHPGVTVEESTWSPSGLAQVVTSAVTFAGVPARAVGNAGWYLRRDGFAWGGLGVAAIWYGGTLGLARRLLEATRAREPDQVALMHLGAVDASLASCRSVLAAAAADIDSGRAAGQAGALTAARVRQVVADAAEDVAGRVAHALGPGPLAHEPDHARRVADLALYVRQHHAERDQVALGRHVLDRVSSEGEPPW